MTKQRAPEWFRIGEPLLWAIPNSIHDIFNADPNLSANERNIVECALINFIHCLNLSVESNRKGQHAVAICLLRQCYESLALIEVGLIQDTARRSSLLTDWINKTKTAGALRKVLSESIWPSYGTGLWDEPWSTLMKEFTQALHPYAHYSPELQSWQLALVEDTARKDTDGSYLLVGAIGLTTYEANKATRITLFHILSVYILGRIAVENNQLSSNKDQLNTLKKAISESEQLCNGALEWHIQFWAHEFSKPK